MSSSFIANGCCVTPTNAVSTRLFQQCCISMHKRLVPALTGRYSTCVSVLFVPQYDSHIAYGFARQDCLM